MTTAASDPRRTASDAPEPDTPVRLSPREIRFVYAGLMVAMLLPAMNMTLVSTALPTIVGELDGLAQMSWIVTAYLLTSTVTVPLVGRASDIYGRKPFYQAAIVVFTLGSVLCGLATDMAQLAVFRAVQGLGGGALMGLTQTIIGDIVSPRQRGRYQGYLGAVFAFATVTGPLLGGLFVDHLTWRWAFFINAPLALVALWVTHRNLPRRASRQRRSIDWLGAAVLVAAASAILLVFQWGGDAYAWLSPQILGLAGAGVAATLLFVLVELRTREPLVPLSLFRVSVFTRGSLIGLLTQASLLGAMVFIPLYFQSVKGATATAAGMMLVPVVGPMLVTSIVSGRLITRTGRYKPFLLVGTILPIVGFGLLATMTAESGYLRTGIGLGLVGSGLGLTMHNVLIAIQNGVPRGQLGVATGGVQFFRMMGATVGVAAFTAVVMSRLTSGLAARVPIALRAGVDPLELVSDPTAVSQLEAALREPVRLALAASVSGAFLVAGALAVLAFFACLTLPEQPLRDDV